MLNAENQGKSKKKYRWHCAVKDEQGNSRFWSVEEYDDETVRKLIFEKNWKVLAVTRVKDDVEKEAEEPSAGKASGIAAMVSIVAVIVSVFVPLSAAILASASLISPSTLSIFGLNAASAAFCLRSSSSFGVNLNWRLLMLVVRRCG